MNKADLDQSLVGCPDCNGTGYVECGECDGTGQTEKWWADAAKKRDLGGRMNQQKGAIDG